MNRYIKLFLLTLSSIIIAIFKLQSLIKTQSKKCLSLLIVIVVQLYNYSEIVTLGELILARFRTKSNVR